MIFTRVLLYISKATGYGDIWLKLLTSKVLVLSARCSSSALSWHLRPSHTTPATSLAFLTNESFIFYLYGHLPSLALHKIFLPLCCGFVLCHHKFLWLHYVTINSYLPSVRELLLQTFSWGFQPKTLLSLLYSSRSL